MYKYSVPPPAESDEHELLLVRAEKYKYSVSPPAESNECELLLVTVKSSLLALDE